MLSEMEKHAIKSMVAEGLKTPAIRKKVGRSGKEGKEVDQFIKELSKTGSAEVSGVVRSGTIARLGKAGLDHDNAVELIDRTLRKMDAIVDVSVEELYNACIANIGARELIKTRTDGGNAGVAVMTGEAAQFGQDLAKARTEISSKAASAIFRPKTGKMANES